MKDELSKVLTLLEKNNEHKYREVKNIKLNSNSLEIGNVISLFKIRARIAMEKRKIDLENSFSELVANLESYSSKYKHVRIVSFTIDDLLYILYLDDKLNEVLGSLYSLIKEDWPE